MRGPVRTLGWARSGAAAVARKARRLIAMPHCGKVKTQKSKVKVKSDSVRLAGDGLTFDFGLFSPLRLGYEHCHTDPGAARDGTLLPRLASGGRAPDAHE